LKETVISEPITVTKEGNQGNPPEYNFGGVGKLFAIGVSLFLIKFFAPEKIVVIKEDDVFQ